MANIPKHEVEEMNELTDALYEKREDMNDWAKKFVTDMYERFEKYGDDTFVSTVQRDKLLELEEKHL